VQNAPAAALGGVGLSRQFGINLQQQRKEFGVLKSGVAHFDGLDLGRKRLSHKDRLFKVVVGDFFCAALAQ
jgi:hypothetical protein